MIAFWLLVALQLADTWTTWRVIHAGGREANPLMAMLIDKLGFWPAFLGMKGLLIWLAWLTVETVVPLLLCALYVIVVVNNLRVLRRQRGG